MKKSTYYLCHFAFGVFAAIVGFYVLMRYGVIG